MRKYVIGTGYVANSKTPVPARDFFNLWYQNTLDWSIPHKIIVLTAGGATPSSDLNVARDLQVIISHGDLGHIRDKHEGRTDFHLVGWTAAMLTLAMLAYNEEADFIYKEQDCLAFGQWVNQLYTDMGDGFAALGRGLQPPHHKLTSSQSLFIVKHCAIPQFVNTYLMYGEDACRPGHFGEQKFRNMMDKYPQVWKEQSAGWNVDRDRPIPYHKDTFAVQQLTPIELDVLKEKGMI